MKKGQKVSEETRQKMKVAQWNRFLSKDARKQISDARIGKTLIPECAGLPLKERQKIYCARRHEKHPYRGVKYTSGFSEDEYLQKFEEQKGLCAICRKPERVKATGKMEPRSLAADHNHETGKHRGLLCALCNTALGKFEDSPDRLRAALDYLEKWEG